ncbi:reticulon-1-like isoform X7 [Salvelinus namaycush]|uniref:Reticulon n=1 Tax=Salvelinus namaycush TaxID=8040 RepID=A0A8U0P292_SALNM|nr:reticulon-1-like isoform X7 [Salvelinus namaycush]
MEDSEQVVSSTTPPEDEMRSYRQFGNHYGNEATAKVAKDDIVDLVGGAQDAIERHMASCPDDLKEFTEEAKEQLTNEVISDITPPDEEQEEEGTDTFSEAKPVMFNPLEADYLPELIRPDPPKVAQEKAPAPVVESAPVEAAPVVEVLPKAAPEKEVIAAPPAPSRVLQRWNLDKRDEHFLPSTPLQPLMQFPKELGQKGDSPAPISPLSPLHSPDSLEDLSLSESPNPTSAPLGFSSWPSTEPPKILTKDMPCDEEGNTRLGFKNDEDIVKGLEAASYTQSEHDQNICLERDVRPKSFCEDSGVVSPEEQICSSVRSATPSQSPQKPSMTPESYIAPASSTQIEHWDSPSQASQDNTRASMDMFSKDSASRGSSGYVPDMLGQPDDDLMFEVKKNPFQGFSPVADDGFSHFGDTTSDSMAAKMSESPTPDLVQYGQAGDSQDGSPPSYYDETKTYVSVKMAADSLMEPLNQFSTTPKESEDSAPPSLPDILKPFPLNPDKVDSGSSEGSTEPSPAPVRKIVESPTVPVTLSATNPFAFDSKALLLKELTEETEARLAVKTEDKGYSAFDLVKEAGTTPQSKEPVQIEQKEWMFSSQDSPKTVNKLEPLNIQTRKTPEDSDSESPSADSLSPVLEAMAKNPASFQVETEKDDMKVEDQEAAEENSEPEVSSEEFEFIERPPRGVMDEFLEAFDGAKFAKAPEPSMDDDDDDDDDMSFGLKGVTSANVAPEVQEEVPSQSSYLLLTQKDKADLEKGKAYLEKDDINEPASQAPLIHSPVREPEMLAKDTEGPKTAKMPNLSTEAVVELLYWRDVKTSGVVFGASLSLLLSLTLCSIVSVSSYIGLALLSVTICFRIYKGILQAIQKSDEGHPFKLYLDQDVALSEGTVHKYSDCVLARFNTTVTELRRLFLVEDLVDSLKFAVLMWILTYVGALFNGLTLFILGLVGMFSCPIVYEKYKVQIDHYVGMANKQVKDIIAMVQAKVPGLKRVKAE